MKRTPVRAAIGTLPRRQRELIDFFEVYETLVETLCDAAQCGTSPNLDEKYRTCRAQIQSAYPPLKPFLISYLEFLPDDTEAGLKLCGRPLDAFEALVASFDLQEFFLMDDGNMISRLTRTRDAMNRYGEHLRLLAERVA